ncbi:glutathione S-transferase [Hypoxylon sp. FL1284]|nr:glutathione S-transferase [Hypoxylon sp. FL1284]
MSAFALRRLLPRHIRVLPAHPSAPVLSASHIHRWNLTAAPPSRARYSSATTSSSTTPPPGQDVEMAEPTGLIAKSGIELLTFGTPNGYKASIMLEELKDAYGKEYTTQTVNIMKNTQKEPWFTAVSPNGRIPAIVDHDRGGFAVFEGLSILLYLGRHYDPENRLSFPVDSDEYSEAEQWMAWQHGGVGPMQGQANHFFRFARDKPAYAVQRYVGETERLYGILDARLSGGRDYVVGGRFSVADIALLGWANVTTLAGLDLPKMFPNVQAWLDRCLARPAVKRGFEVPDGPSSMSNEAMAKAYETDPEKRKKADEAFRFLNECKEQYGYKYASP